jgi:hypothetical protein
VPVLVNGTTYDVTYFIDSYDDNTSRFTTAEMPWWGDYNLAITFANAIGGDLGTPLLSVLPPAFAYAKSVGIVSVYVGNTGGTALSSNVVAPYAIATPQSPAPVPAPLPLFGAAAAFSATRRLRSMSRTLHRSTTAGA